MKKLLFIALLLPSFLCASSIEKKKTSKHIRSASVDASKKQKLILTELYNQSWGKKLPNTVQKNNDGTFTESEIREANKTYQWLINTYGTEKVLGFKNN